MRRRAFITILASGGAVTYSISGTVYDADGSTAVASATVAIGAHSTTSAANGTYTLTGFITGESGSMTCTKAGYSWTAITVAAMSGNLTSQNYTNAWWAAGGSAASCVRAYKAAGAASLVAAYSNLVSPGTGDMTYTVQDGAAVLTADGVFIDTNFGSLKSGYTPAGIVDLSLFIRVKTIGTGSLCGTLKAAEYFTIAYSGGNYTFYRGEGSLTAIAAGANTTSIAICNRKLYIAGALAGTAGDTATPTPTAALKMWTANPAIDYGMGAGTFQYGAIYSAELTAPQVAMLHAATANP